ncbi:hypothetical protein KAK05_00630 [Candidatus Parcubacteria bacterium]|nr:hypothetical protein [Candidatus Parcubacteria bacterium]
MKFHRTNKFQKDCDIFSLKADEPWNYTLAGVYTEFSSVQGLWKKIKV